MRNHTDDVRHDPKPYTKTLDFQLSQQGGPCAAARMVRAMYASRSSMMDACAPGKLTIASSPQIRSGPSPPCAQAKRLSAMPAVSAYLSSLAGCLAHLRYV